MRNWIGVVSTMMMLAMLMETFLGTHGYHETPSAKKLKEENKRCEKILARQTESFCEKRLQHCCRSGKNTIREPVCATTTNGFGVIFYNPCSMYYIRCLYPEVCFLKRAPSHPHCSPYQVMTQDAPLDIPCHLTTSKTDITTLPPTTLTKITPLVSSSVPSIATRNHPPENVKPTTLPDTPFKGDDGNSPLRPAIPKTPNSPLYKTLMKTLPPSITDGTSSTSGQYLPRTLPTTASVPMPSTLSSIIYSTKQQVTDRLSSEDTITLSDSTPSTQSIGSTVKWFTVTRDFPTTPKADSTTSKNDILPRTSPDVTLTQTSFVSSVTTEMTPPAECGKTVNFTCDVSVHDAMHDMYNTRTKKVRSDHDNDLPQNSSGLHLYNCKLPPPKFPLCSFPNERERS